MSAAGKTLKKIAIGTAIAGAAGYIAGIMSAPKAGKQTRKELKKAAKMGMAGVEEELKEMQAELTEIITNVKSGGHKMPTNAQDKLNGALENAKKTKDKLHQVLNALHDGEATDSDLDKALEDAKQALNHLKQYLKK